MNLNIIIVKPVGISIEKVTNNSTDIWKLMKQVNNVVYYIHIKNTFCCNISANNIVIIESQTIFIDWKIANNNGKYTLNQRIGTSAFCSFTIFKFNLNYHKKKKYTYQTCDDFESLFK